MLTTTRILVGDVRTRLRELPDESVHCCVTSPPYWGLRDYGCDGQIGLEASPQAHIAALVDVFGEVWRVLRPDGTLWLNYGDAYASNAGGYSGDPDRQLSRAQTTAVLRDSDRNRRSGFKPKDLMLLPHRLAIALQDAGWYVRSAIVWAKGVSFCDSYSGSVMPESCRDRPTSAYEMVFLLTKWSTYFYDAEAVRESATCFGTTRGNYDSKGTDGLSKPDFLDKNHTYPSLRNLRNVWTINPEPCPDAHFATFPQALVEPCIKAGTSERGCCPGCGAPWERVVERKVHGDWNKRDCADANVNQKRDGGQAWKEYEPPKTTGWRPTCPCVERSGEWPEIPTQGRDETDQQYRARVAPLLALRSELIEVWRGEPASPAVVCDPFAGSGTVGLVAAKLQRSSVLIELNPEYIEIARRRLAEVGTLFNRVTVDNEPTVKPPPADDGVSGTYLLTRPLCDFHGAEVAKRIRKGS